MHCIGPVFYICTYRSYCYYYYDYIIITNVITFQSVCAYLVKTVYATDVKNRHDTGIYEVLYEENNANVRRINYYMICAAGQINLTVSLAHAHDSSYCSSFRGLTTIYTAASFGIRCKRFLIYYFFI